jgi:integrase
VVVQLVVTMEYLAQDSKSGRYRYRRRVPGELIKLIGKREFSISLKTTDQRLALERYERVHREVESEIEAARAVDPADADHRATLQTLRKHDLVAPTLKSLAPVTFQADPETFKKFTDAALRAPDHEFDRIVEAKFFGVQEPPLRLSKATQAYLDEHRDGDNENDLRKQTKLVVDLVREVTKESDPLVEAIDIDVAYAFRDAMRAKGSARGTIKRRINTIRALLNFAKQRFQLTAYVNPFSGLDVPKTASDRRAKDRRLPLTVEEIKRCNPFVMAKNADIADLWTMMMFTGARPRELLGLEWQDVDLVHDVPHIIIRPNGIRGVKTDTSVRKVPLVGKALEVARARAKQAAKQAHGAVPVFPRYASTSGYNTASNLMTKAMKQAGVWERITKVPYSLRHSHKDWMRRVAPEYWVNLIHGHAQGGIAANYGGDDMLDQLAKYVDQACRAAGVSSL